MTIQTAVFISHSWSYSDHYDTLAEWIFEESWNSGETPLEFVDRSIPRDDPIHYAENEEQLRAVIYERINQSSVIVIPTGMYANHSYWIQKEIDGALNYHRPILAVNPWGQERKSSVVAEAAQASVGWNKDSVINGIWKLRQQVPQ
jgi:hypothetical protein